MGPSGRWSIAASAADAATNKGVLVMSTAMRSPTPNPSHAPFRPVITRFGCLITRFGNVITDFGAVPKVITFRRNRRSASH